MQHNVTVIQAEDTNTVQYIEIKAEKLETIDIIREDTTHQHTITCYMFTIVTYSVCYKVSTV